jgi:predicted GIY-YIG superfamily endonuclease
MTDTQSTQAVNSPVEFLYRLRASSGELLYVGITRDWPARMKQHQADKPWWSDVAAVELVRVLGTRQQIEAIEKAVIKSEQPIYNKTHNGEVRRTLTAPAFDPCAGWPVFKVGQCVTPSKLSDQYVGYGTIVARTGRNNTVDFPAINERWTLSDGELEGDVLWWTDDDPDGWVTTYHVGDRVITDETGPGTLGEWSDSTAGYVNVLHDGMDFEIGVDIGAMRKVGK